MRPRHVHSKQSRIGLRRPRRAGGLGLACRRNPLPQLRSRRETRTPAASLPAAADDDEKDPRAVAATAASPALVVAVGGGGREIGGRGSAQRKESETGQRRASGVWVRDPIGGAEAIPRERMGPNQAGLFFSSICLALRATPTA